MDTLRENDQQLMRNIMKDLKKLRKEDKLSLKRKGAALKD
jgi:hypothetical protein